MTVSGRNRALFLYGALSLLVAGATCLLFARDVIPVAAKQVPPGTPPSRVGEGRLVSVTAVPPAASVIITPLPSTGVTPVSTIVGTFPPSEHDPDAGRNTIMSTPVAPPPGPTAVPGPDDPHVSYSVTTSSCAACHRSHTAEGHKLRLEWPEENVCFGCHTSQGSGTDILSTLLVANSATAFYQHNATGTEGIHNVEEADGSAFGNENRHIECEDCHEPHEATRGMSDAPIVQPEMNRVTGVDPMWDAPGPPEPSRYVWLNVAEREYQVCFKCHSSYTALSAYVPDGWDGTSVVPDGLRKLTSVAVQQVPDNRDLAQEFNPFNASFHPVVELGSNQSIPAASFVPGWSQSSIVYCSDCHTNADDIASGPHGSPRLHLLDGGQEYTSVMTGVAPSAQDQELCFKCHDAATYLDRTNTNATNTNFRRAAGNRNLHGTHMTRQAGRAATCYACHDTHGSEQEHLLNFEVVPGMLTINSGNSQTAWRANGNQWECALTCHGRAHTMPGFRYP